MTTDALGFLACLTAAVVITAGCTIYALCVAAARPRPTRPRDET